MALVTRGYEVTVQLIDRGSNTTTRRYPLIDTIVTEAAAQTEATAILAALANVTDLAVKGYTIGHRYEEDALVIPITAGAEVSTHAEISGLLEGFATKRATIDIPGPKDAIFVATYGPNYNVVDMSAGQPAAIYATLFSSVANVTVSDGEQFAQPVPDWSGKRTHSKSRNG